jgi:hypothetical protein
MDNKHQTIDYYIELENPKAPDGKAMVYSEFVDGLDESAIPVRRVVPGYLTMNKVEFLCVLDHLLECLEKSKDFKATIEKELDDLFGE